MSRVFLLDDHESFRQSLAWLLGREEDFEVAAQVGTLAESRERLGEPGEIDVAVIDVILPDGNGTEMIGELRAANPGVSVLVLTIVPDEEVHRAALRMGADLVLTKDTSLQEIVDAVRRLGEG